MIGNYINYKYKNYTNIKHIFYIILQGKKVPSNLAEFLLYGKVTFTFKN